MTSAVAAYPARGRFGYPATAIIAALGYRDHGRVGQAAGRRGRPFWAALQRRLDPATMWESVGQVSRKGGSKRQDVLLDPWPSPRGRGEWTLVCWRN